jgi:hypothetical protein
MSSRTASFTPRAWEHADICLKSATPPPPRAASCAVLTSAVARPGRGGPPRPTECRQQRPELHQRSTRAVSGPPGDAKDLAGQSSASVAQLLDHDGRAARGENTSRSSGQPAFPRVLSRSCRYPRMRRRTLLGSLLYELLLPHANSTCASAESASAACGRWSTIWACSPNPTRGFHALDLAVWTSGGAAGSTPSLQEGRNSWTSRLGRPRRPSARGSA